MTSDLETIKALDDLSSSQLQLSLSSDIDKRFEKLFKMMNLLFFMCFVFTSYGASSHFFTPCKKDDNECLVSSARAALPIFAQGVPELGLQPLDPLHIPLIESDHSGLKLQFKNTTLTGLKGCVIEKIKSDLTKLKQSVTLKCSMVMKGDYSLKGQLIVLPVEGEGKFELDINDMVVKAHVDLATVTISGAPHWHISKWHHTSKVLTGAKFNFENLFNGNKVLADPVLEFANSNWKDVIEEIAPPVIEVIIAQIIGAIEAFYVAVPVGELVQE